VVQLTAVAGKVELTPPRGACWGLCMVYSLQIAKVYCKLSLHHDQSRNRRRWVEFFGGLAEEENFSRSTNDSNFLPNILTTLKPITDSIYEDRGNWGRRLADPREGKYRAQGHLRWNGIRGGGLGRRKGRGYSSLSYLSREIRTTWDILNVIWWPPQLAVGGSQSQAFGTFAHTRNAFYKVYGGTEIPRDKGTRGYLVEDVFFPSWFDYSIK
jgi:hypothetical protein